MNRKRILIVDDERDFCFMIKQNLEMDEEFIVCDCFTGDGFTSIKGFLSISHFVKFLDSRERPDIIILDLGLPGIDGLQICKALKEKYPLIPIIILSGKGEEFDKVSCLNMGADDYVVKPFSVEELKARIGAILRRQGSQEKKKKVINICDLILIDYEKHCVTVGKKRVELTSAEFMILWFLCSRKNIVLSRTKILGHLWGSSKGVTQRTIDVHIRHLRKKLGKAAKFIKNVRGVGYKLEEE